MRKLAKTFSVFAVAVLVLLSGVFSTALPKVSAATVTSIVAFGDSNTTGWLQGTTSWFVYLQNKLHAGYPANSFSYTNLGVNGSSITPTYNGNTNMQYDIAGKLATLTPSDIGLVMLGTNDAWQGQDITNWQNYYQKMIRTIQASGKIARLYIMSVPLEMSPFNCIGTTCWRNTHNPETERVVPFNNFLSGIATYCSSIGYTCSYINSNNGLVANSTYLNPGDGIHLLNAGQNVVAQNVYNTLVGNPMVSQSNTRYGNYVSENVYTNLLPKQVAQVRVTMRNTGKVAWTQAGGYKLGLVGSNSWGITRVLLNTGESVQPGQSRDFVFNIAAPAAAGNYTFQWQMLQEGVVWLGDKTPAITVSVSSTATRNALFVSQSVPCNMYPGQTAQASVTIENSGSNTWDGNSFYGIGLTSSANAVWGTVRNYLGPGETIAPGQQRTFTFNITAPTTPGVYNFQWQPLQENVTWFGSATPLTPINVLPAYRDATFVSQTVPTTIIAGQPAQVSITMQNTGTMNWTTTDFYGLGIIKDNVWGVGRSYVGSTVAPGQQVTFTFNITAPTTPGIYNFQWQMLQENVTWFGAQTPNLQITVQ